MKKFNIKYTCNTLYVHNKTDSDLFTIGYGDIFIVKKGNGEKKPYSKQNSFGYKGIKNTLCGKEYPKLKQFIVI